ncbi:MAG: opine dehydrogenase [Candidatus Brocadiaceae bacterium]|mgnify:CR=1 FL=1|nr:opine dehydrogenase [Candidatus Brocadiaceae bacterium]
MRTAVLGSGNGGCAVAFDCASHGHDVRLFDFEEFPDSVAAVAAAGGVSAEGELNGFAPVTYAGHDVEAALDGADVILAVGPAYSIRHFAAACRPHLREGQMVVVCPGSSGGAVEFKSVAGLSLGDRRIVIAETHTLPYAVRMGEPGRIRIFLKLKAAVLVAAAPAVDTPAVIEALGDVYPCLEPARNVLQTSLQNANPVIHPAVTLLNAALIERTGGDFRFYEDGVTPAVGRVIEALDRERIAIGKRLGVEVLPDPELGVRQGYMTEATYDAGYSEAPGFLGIMAQSRLDHRYLNEDVGYGLVFMADLARQVRVPTPCMDAVIRLASAAMGRDYAGEAKRTMASLGLAGKTADEMERLLG